MCGICGFITEDTRQVEPVVQRMMRSMLHRGPDDEGYAQFPLAGETGPVAAFGFRRLSILDLSSAGHQPMVNAQTGDCLVFNGEIYNFRDLRSRLAAKGIECRSSGDAEVLLKALSYWGEAALDEIDGMFAFAFYQASTRRVLFARDHMGIKPLYIARLPDGLLFASEVRALLASGRVPTDIDEAGVATFLAYGAPQDPLTMHRFIKSFPAASCQWVGAEAAAGKAAAAPRRFWRFPPVREPGAGDQAVDEIRHLLEGAVRDQCVSDVPMAVFLSAGIDSATLAAFAQREVGKIRTFAVGNDVVKELDESSEAAETARLLGVTHVQTIVDDDWIFSEWREWLLFADRPSIDGLNAQMVCNAVKTSGYTVALSGLGADELFGGYHTFDHVRRLRKFMAPFAWLPASIRRGLPKAAFFAPPAKRQRAAGLLVDPSYVGLTLGMRRVFDDEELAALGFDSERLGLTPHWMPPEAFEPFRDVTWDLFRAVSQADAFFFMSNMLLRDTDINSMANSVEVRVPFLSRRLIDLVGSIPSRLHFPPGPARKHLLRAAVSGVVPEKVMARRKRGFVLPLGRWMNGPLRADCDARVGPLFASGLMQADPARCLWRRFQANATDSDQRRQAALVALGYYVERMARA